MITVEIRTDNLIVTFLIAALLLSSGIPVKGTQSRTQVVPTDDQCYGFLINVSENQSYGLQVNITRLLNSLLKQNVSIYWITHDITLSTQGLEKGSGIKNHTFQKGCFIIAFSLDSTMNTKTTALVYQKWLASRLNAYKIMQPLENFTAYRLLEPRIACYNCTSMDHYWFRAQLMNAGFSNVDLLTAQQAKSNLTTDNYDVFIWGGQMGTYFETIIDTLSITGLHMKKYIKDFVGAGGNYIGACYDVYRALPGAGQVNLTIKNLTHPLAFGLPDHLSNLWYFAGPLFRSRPWAQSEKEVMGVLSEVNINRWEYYDYRMDFVPFWNNRIFSNETKYTIAHHWMNDSIGATMWINGMFGKGKVILFGVHPEYTLAIDGNEDYSSPPRIIYNSIWYTTAQGPSTHVLEFPATFSNITVDAGGPYTAKVDQPLQVNGNAFDGESPFKWYWEFELTYHEYFYKYPYNNTREEQHPWFTFSDSGTYQITLVVTDASGDIGYDITTVNVT
jgi:glutamine amidotransferase-like uncharacterized protein